MKKNLTLIFAALLALSWYQAVSEAASRPKEMEAHLEKAAELEKKEIYVDAVTEYESALEYAPDDVDIRVKMAEAYLNSGDSNKFMSVCKETAETYQDDTKAMDMLMEYYIENDSQSSAVQYLSEFTESYPKNKNAQKWFLELEGSYTELYCRYEELSDLVNESMVVQEEGLYGLADAQGKEIIEAGYEELHPLSEDGYALAKKAGGAYIYIDKEGRTRKAPDDSYEDLGMYASGRAAARKDGKYGYLDEDMEPAGKFVWDALTGFRENAGAGKKDGKWVLVDKKGEAKKDKETYEDVVIDETGFCSGQKRIFVKQGGSFHMINTKGKEVGELTFDDAKAFTENGYAAVCKDGKWGFVDPDGELVIDYTYEDAESFQNGFAAVCVDGRWGFVDIKGNLAIDPEFFAPAHISQEGTAAVRTEADGEKVWKLIQLNLFQ